MRYRLDLSDLDHELLVEVLEYSIPRGSGQYRTLKHKIERSNIIRINRTYYEHLIQSMVAFQGEHVEGDINHLWSSLRQAVREYPELEAHLNDRWMDVY